MKPFFCECIKTKAKLFSILLPVLAIILLWTGWVARDPDPVMQETGYTYMTTTLLLLNSIFLPITAAVMASRLMDMENKGNTYKLLCTLQEKSTIFTCKLLLASCHLLVFFAAETALLFGIGQWAGFTQSFPVGDYLRLQGIGYATCLLLFILQMFFSLLLANQLYPLFIGLIGSFLGLFSMFLPNGSFLLYWCPWSYFTLGGSHLMVYEETTREMTFLRIPFNYTGGIVLFAALLTACFAVRRYFLRKEV